MYEPLAIDLFSGIGGFTVAGHRAGFRTIQFVENDARCQKFLASAYPGIPIHSDIRDFDAKPFAGRVDIVQGGPPCQPISCAGKRRGKEDDRWLWDETLAAVEIIRPAWCLFENPAAIRTMGLDGILARLENAGYSTRTFDIPACAVNSPQLRHRYWIVAHRTGARCARGMGHSYERGFGEGEGVENATDGASLDVADASRDSEGRIQTPSGADRERTGEQVESCNLADDDSAPWSNFVWLPCADGKFRRAPDDSFGVVDGLSVDLLAELGQTHRSLLAALGNSIVWPVAYEILKAIKHEIDKKRMTADTYE